jgi:UDPglucose 6-dehydrogenase
MRIYGISFDGCLLSSFLHFHSFVELTTCHVATVAQSSKIVVEKSTVPCRTTKFMRTTTIPELNCRFNHQLDLLLLTLLVLPKGSFVTDKSTSKNFFA